MLNNFAKGEGRAKQGEPFFIKEAKLKVWIFTQVFQV